VVEYGVDVVDFCSVFFLGWSGDGQVRGRRSGRADQEELAFAEVGDQRAVALREAGDGDKGAEVKVVEDFEDDWEREAAKARSAHWVVGEGRHGGAVEGREGGGRCLAEWVGRGGKRNKRKETKEGTEGETTLECQQASTPSTQCLRPETSNNQQAIASIKLRPSLLQ